MSRLYASPLRVYLCLGALALAGIYSGLKLPVSLFPNSSKPVIGVSFSYGSSTADEFFTTYGRFFEGQLRSISADSAQAEKLRASYGRTNVTYRVEFKWGTPPEKALNEVELVAHSFAARLPMEIRDSLGVWTNQENSGFFAASFYSPTLSLDELYDILEPVLGPQISQVRDSREAELWNPLERELGIELDPGKMASLQLFPKDVTRAIADALNGQSGGSITVGTQQLPIQMPRTARTQDRLGRISIPTPSGRIIRLSDIARIDFGAKTGGSRSFKTSGAPSLILFADPKPGGNVKRMSEDLIRIIEGALSGLPPALRKEIQYRILVDPSEFIRSSVNNVLREVGVGALLAVGILFLFVGSLRNTATAAIEIPLSMVLAFILMRVSGMNLNLISLGGLALSAGMNVDASVVVMENIFRHFEGAPRDLNFQAKLALITRAVGEVRFAVVASTISSLVVFLPLAFTSDLSYAILGDLAKTVVFSHGFSMFVALILVPTVRLQLLSSGGDRESRSPIEGWIRKLEEGYGRALGKFLESRKLQTAAYGGLACLLALLCALVLPALPTEIIGRPDTDWMYLSVATQGNTRLRQMESQSDEIEARLLARFGDKIQYTFTQVQDPNRGSIMSRLKRKEDMEAIWKGMEAHFSNTPFLKFYVGPWNPAELPIPDPPQMRIAVRGGTLSARTQAAQELVHLIEGKEVFDRVWSDPALDRSESVLMTINPDLWSSIQGGGSLLAAGDLADLSRVATIGKRVGYISIDGRITDVMMRYPEGKIRSAEDLAALPIGIRSKVIPLKALARISVEESAPTRYRENESDMIVIYGKQNEGSSRKGSDALKNAKALVDRFKPSSPAITVTFEDAEKDLHDALWQLGMAVGVSVLLIFLTLVLQFGSIANALLVLIAVPLGFIGVLLALFAFRSTLSLNSVLGVILLNGIAVANSIILVDFLKQLVDQKCYEPGRAAVEAGKRRLRPILITSLTTILGMLPIALGLGEGGRILQPLGIAVSGGLWVSMGLTLFIVPGLQVSYLKAKSRSRVLR